MAGRAAQVAREASVPGGRRLRGLNAGIEEALRTTSRPAVREAHEPTDDVSVEPRRADALGLPESDLIAGLDPGNRGDRYQVVVHVGTEACLVLMASLEGHGREALPRPPQAGGSALPPFGG